MARIREESVINMDGMKFGYLTVINRSEKTDKNGNHLCTCVCECGNKIYVLRSNLMKGTSHSCGCKRSEFAKNRKNYKDFDKDKKLYHVHYNMISRCTNPKHNAYLNYGGRGISVCEEWMNSFEKFVSWSRENGYEEGLSLDRIDNDKNYSPDNCRWVDMEQQSNNRRNTIYCFYEHDLVPVTQLARKLGITRKRCLSIFGGYKRV